MVSSNIILGIASVALLLAIVGIVLSILPSSGSSGIDDAVSSTEKSYSSKKTDDLIAQLRQEIETLKNTVETLSTKINNLPSTETLATKSYVDNQITTVNNKIGTLPDTTTATSIASYIASVNNKIGTLPLNVTSVASYIGTLPTTTTATSIASYIASVDNKIGTLPDNNTVVSYVNGKITEVNTKVDNMSKTVADDIWNNSTRKDDLIEEVTIKFSNTATYSSVAASIVLNPNFKSYINTDTGFLNALNNAINFNEKIKDFFLSTNTNNQLQQINVGVIKVNTIETLNQTNGFVIKDAGVIHTRVITNVNDASPPQGVNGSVLINNVNTIQTNKVEAIGTTPEITGFTNIKSLNVNTNTLGAYTSGGVLNINNADVIKARIITSLNDNDPGTGVNNNVLVKNVSTITATNVTATNVTATTLKADTLDRKGTSGSINISNVNNITATNVTATTLKTNTLDKNTANITISNVANIGVSGTISTANLTVTGTTIKLNDRDFSWNNLVKFSLITGYNKGIRIANGSGPEDPYKGSWLELNIVENTNQERRLAYWADAQDKIFGRFFINNYGHHKLS